MATKQGMLKDRINDKVTKARGIAEKAEAEGRDFNAAERREVDRLFTEAKADAAELKAVKADDEALAELFNLGNGGRQSRAPEHRFGWAKAYQMAAGFKDAITPSGSVTVPVLSSGIAPLKDRPETLLSAIEFEPLDSDSFQFNRQTAGTNAAAGVAAGHRKPVSDITVAPVIDRARVIAHLSGGVDRSSLSDSNEVGTFLETVMATGVLEALETMVIAGDSADPLVDDFDGILNTSGTLAEPFAVDILTTIRKAVTRLQRAKIVGPYLIVLSAGVWESLELLTSDETFTLGDPGVGGRSLPVDTARQALWGHRVAVSEAVGDDTAIVGDFSSRTIKIKEREGVRIDWSEATQLQVEGETPGVTDSGFRLNRVQMRCEARYGLEFKRPGAMVIADLTAGS